jgi:hypothetical protein
MFALFPTEMPADSPGCAECKELWERFTEAIRRELKAVLRLQSAHIHDEPGSPEPLEAALHEEALARENAMAEYERHRRTHAMAESAANRA